MRTAAEILVVITGRIYGENRILREIINQLGLELLIVKQFSRLVAGILFYAPILFALQNLAHFILDHREIILGQISRQYKVVVKSIRNLRSDCILHILSAKNFNDRFCEHMCQRVAIYLKICFSIHFLVLLNPLTPALLQPSNQRGGASNQFCPSRGRL